MNHFKKIILILVSVVFTLVSCEKNQDENNNPNPNQPVVPENNIQACQDYFSNNMELVKQSFVIDAENGGTITSNSNTQVTFYGNSFLNGMAQDVTGDITIELVELFNNSEQNHFLFYFVPLMNIRLIKRSLSKKVSLGLLIRFIQNQRYDYSNTTFIHGALLAMAL